jgi:hypothetical protein
MTRELSTQDKYEAFMRAVHSFANAKERWQQRAASGLTDDELKEALRYELGIAGGSSCSDSIKVEYQGAGLKIWASWDSFNHYGTKPIFEGADTIAFAREVFGISNPDDEQLSLF